MVQFILGIALGMYVATHNVMEIAEVLDQSVQTMKTVKVTTEKQ